MDTDELNAVNDYLEKMSSLNFTYDSSNITNNPEDVEDSPLDGGCGIDMENEPIENGMELENDCMDGGCGMDMGDEPMDNGMNVEEGNQEDNQQQANSPDVRLSYWYNHRI